MKLLHGVLFAMTMLLAAVAGAQDLSAVSMDAPVGPRDVLDVKVLEDQSVNGRYTVGDDGMIVLPYFKLDVTGLTARGIEARLKSQLEANFIPKATVSVQVVEYASKPISVIGAVVRPGRIGASSNTTLIQAITEAGGLAAGHGSELYVLRTGRNGLSEQLAINVDDLMIRGNPDLNIPLAPNDLVNVPLDAPVRIYVMGEVMRPGTVDFRRSQTPTLLQAITAAGGPTDRASRRAIVKRIVDGKQTTMKINYRSIIDGDQQDLILQDNDIVVINESLF